MTNCKMEGFLRYEDNANYNDNARVLSPLLTEDWL